MFSSPMLMLFVHSLALRAVGDVHTEVESEWLRQYHFQLFQLPGDAPISRFWAPKICACMRVCAWVCFCVYVFFHLIFLFKKKTPVISAFISHSPVLLARASRPLPCSRSLSLPLSLPNPPFPPLLNDVLTHSLTRACARTHTHTAAALLVLFLFYF